MTKTVWKYQIDKNPGLAKVLTMPKGANVLRAGIQNGIVCLWACVVPATSANAEETRVFMYSGTGHGVPVSAKYVGGCSDIHYSGTQFEWHVWELFR